MKHNLIKNDTRKDLLGNRLVLIAPKDSKIGNVTIAPGFDLAGARRLRTHRDRRCARGPGRPLCQGGAGEARYLAEPLNPKLAMAENVRAALVLVARGEAPLGIVYETDAESRSERQDHRRVSRQTRTLRSSIRWR